MFDIKIHPSINEIKEKLVNSSKKTFVPVWAEVIADLETPVSAYNKITKGEKHSFLLESVEGGEAVGRYSFIGFAPEFIIKADDKTSPYDVLERFLTEYTSLDFNIPLPPGAVGYLGFDTIRFIEPKLHKLYENIEKCESFPDAYFMAGGMMLAFDHAKHKIYVISNMLVENAGKIEELYEQAQIKIKNALNKLSSPHTLEPFELSIEEHKTGISSNISRDEWDEAIIKAKKYIEAGDIFQVVISQRFCVDKTGVDDFTIYRALRSINPSPYLYYLDFNEFKIIGSSPEALVKCSKDRIVHTRPIAGTRKRGKTQEEDIKLADELISDPKERAEHVMLVDLARNDIGRVCEYGSVEVKRFMAIEKFSHVMHIVSDVTGTLRHDLNSIDLLKACFPAGTVSGAPKVRAMEIIYELEKSARGPYAGCIGYLGLNNEINVAITLRTMLVRGNNVFIQAGGGIVADSEPDFEFRESQNKAAALIQAVLKLKN